MRLPSHTPPSCEYRPKWMNRPNLRACQACTVAMSGRGSPRGSGWSLTVAANKGAGSRHASVAASAVRMMVFIGHSSFALLLQATEQFDRTTKFPSPFWGEGRGEGWVFATAFRFRTLARLRRAFDRLPAPESLLFAGPRHRRSGGERRIRLEGRRAGCPESREVTQRNGLVQYAGITNRKCRGCLEQFPPMR